MTFDIWFRYVILLAMGSAALVAIVITLWQEVREWRNGEW